MEELKKRGPELIRWKKVKVNSESVRLNQSGSCVKFSFDCEPCLQLFSTSPTSTFCIFFASRKRATSSRDGQGARYSSSGIIWFLETLRYSNSRRTVVAKNIRMWPACRGQHYWKSPLTDQQCVLMHVKPAIIKKQIICFCHWIKTALIQDMRTRSLCLLQRFFENIWE